MHLFSRKAAVRAEQRAVPTPAPTPTVVTTLPPAQALATPIGPKVSRQQVEVLVHLCQNNDLPRVATSLQRESGITISSEGQTLKGLAPDQHAALTEKHMAIAASHHEGKRRAEELADKMNSHHQRMTDVKERLRNLRQAQPPPVAPDLEAGRVLNEQLQASEAEARQVQLRLDNVNTSVTRLKAQLLAAERELANLRANERKVEAKPPPSPPKPIRPMTPIRATGEKTDAQKLQSILASWNAPGGLRSVAEQIFRECDADCNGCLQWNNNEIRGFVKRVFQTAGVAMPYNAEVVWYDLYRKTDVNRSYSLELNECTSFAFACLEAALQGLLVLPSMAQSSEYHPTAHAVEWARDYKAEPLHKTVVTYGCGVQFDFRAGYMSEFSQVISANSQHRARMATQLEAGDHVRQTLNMFYACDKDCNGCLTWENGEIANFIVGVYRHYDLTPPSESAMYSIYQKFDRDRNSALDARECVEIVDALFRATFVSGGVADGGVNSRYVTGENVASGPVGMVSVAPSVRTAPVLPTAAAAYPGAYVTSMNTTMSPSRFARRGSPGARTVTTSPGTVAFGPSLAAGYAAAMSQGAAATVTASRAGFLMATAGDGVTEPTASAGSMRFSPRGASPPGWKYAPAASSPTMSARV